MHHFEEFLKLVEKAKQNIEEITCEKAHELHQLNQAQFIDVRESEEWVQGHIPKALHLSKGILERDILKNVSQKDQTLVIYCAGGFRSAISADNLQNMGYTKVYSMQGGFKAWESSGYEVSYD